MNDKKIEIRCTEEEKENWRAISNDNISKLVRELLSDELQLQTILKDVCDDKNNEIKNNEQTD
jgi:hypothetical protein